MKTIFKTKLDICDFQTIELPQNYNILHIDKQNGSSYIWYECDSDMPIVKLGLGYGNEPVSLRTYDATQRTDCPYRQTERKRYRPKEDKNQLKLEL